MVVTNTKKTTQAQSSYGARKPKKPKDGVILLHGIVKKKEPNYCFQVELVDQNPMIKGKVILSRTSGKIKKFSVAIVVGDWVTLEISPYDTALSKSRIIKRLQHSPFEESANSNNPSNI